MRLPAVFRSIIETAANADAVYRSADLVPWRTTKSITDMRICADGAFDLIVCSHVLEHVPDDAANRELFAFWLPAAARS
jgi:2-polyprenyl-3-methyl-5-hydroxy-6-metoxy-1,4-benzoquinol methylase